MVGESHTKFSVLLWPNPLVLYWRLGPSWTIKDHRKLWRIVETRKEHKNFEGYYKSKMDIKTFEKDHYKNVKDHTNLWSFIQNYRRSHKPLKDHINLWRIIQICKGSNKTRMDHKRLLRIMQNYEQSCQTGLLGALISFAIYVLWSEHSFHKKGHDKKNGEKKNCENSSPLMLLQSTA